MIDESKKVSMNKKKIQLTDQDANSRFFRLVKSFSTTEKPQTFDVGSLRPGLQDDQVAEELEHAEFEPLTEGEIPSTYRKKIGPLRTHEVARQICQFQKPKSVYILWYLRIHGMANGLESWVCYSYTKEQSSRRFWEP